MSETVEIYDSKYTVDSNGNVFVPTKTGKARKIKPTLFENKYEQSYMFVVLKVNGAGGEEKRTQFPLKKIMADHFPIRTFTDGELSETKEYLSDLQHRDIDHIDGDIYNCSADNLFYYVGGKPKNLANKTQSNGCTCRRATEFYRVIDGSRKMDIGEKPLPMVPNYTAMSDGKIYSQHKKKEVEIKPFFNNKDDKHLSINLTSYGTRTRYCLPDLIIRTFRKDIFDIEMQPYKIFYENGDSQDCHISNLIVARKLTSSETEELKSELIGKDEAEVERILYERGIIEK